MNPISHLSSQVHHVAGVLCIGLAVFVGVQCVEREAIQCEGAYRGSPTLDEPKATDYAHAVPAASPKNWTRQSSALKGASTKTTGYDGACPTQPCNPTSRRYSDSRSIRFVDDRFDETIENGRLQDRSKASLAVEYFGTRPTSGSPHEAAKPERLQILLTLHHCR